MAFERYVTRLDRHIQEGTLTDGVFRRLVMSFYQAHGRTFAWRETRDPYPILVSEVMLQQTQTARVAERYPLFLKHFPTVRALARASQVEVLSAWEGLGYYRRARNLHRAARVVCDEHGGRLPASCEALQTLPGVGAYTAAAVSAFAWNDPRPMVETNIRAVYLYAFFPRRRKVSDAAILTRVEESMDRTRCREWFYALMDFGVELKRARPKIHTRSKHHVTQSRFEGSNRQIAARVLRFVTRCGGSARIDEVARHSGAEKERVLDAIARLARDGMLQPLSRGVVRVA